MILSDREIRAALVRESIRITPDPQTDPDVWSSTALDVRRHEELGRWNFPAGGGVVLHPGTADFNFNAAFQAYGTTIQIPSEGYVIQPGEFCLGWTIERVQLPFRSRIAARVEGRSSRVLGRLIDGRLARRVGVGGDGVEHLAC